MRGINRFIKHIGRTYFAPTLELRVRLFHVLAMGGTLISLLISIFAILNNSGLMNITFNIMSAALSFALLRIALKTGKYQTCYMITIFVIFMVLFPVLFFSIGVYHSGMPAFFVFAVAFTIFMLEGKKAVFFSVAELLIYISICLIAYYRPETISEFYTEAGVLTDIIVAFTAVSIVLGVCMFLHFRLYNEQQKKLDEQNAILAEANRAKTEFLANMSHEMRTPLTVMSVSVQTVTRMLEDMGTATQEPETKKLLVNTQSEIMRLSRMVGGMLDIASMSGSADRTAVDLSALLRSGAEMLRLSLDKRGNKLQTDIKDELKIFGNADLLTQVITNLLQNANTYTENGIITLSTKRDGGEITVTVNNTGSGIDSELLPHVFERGTTTGGTGIGLYLCKTIVESHGGNIWIESELNKGATVYYTLPVYGGQIGGAK